jgi:pyruvate decarboxylase
MPGIPLGRFLFARLRQVGLNAVQAVPSQNNFEILNQAISAGLEWTQHSSDLNAGFAADGYGQIRGIAALITSFESLEKKMSVKDAISGSYEGMVPVVVIVGTPPRMEQFQAIKFHHRFCDSQPDVLQQFANWFTKITVTQEILLDPNEATDQIDNAIRECILQSRPVYIELPEDMVDMNIFTTALDDPLDLNLPPNDDELEQTALVEIMSRIRMAERPVILIDAGASTCGTREINRLAKRTGFPTATTSVRRGLVDETLQNFHGPMCSKYDRLGAYVESSDLIFHIGPIKTMFWSPPFVPEFKRDTTITFNWNCIAMGHQLWEVSSRLIFQEILRSLSQERLQDLATYPDLPNVRESIDMLPVQKKATPLRHDVYASLWRRISSFFCPGDLILTETVTAGEGARSFVLPRNAIVINSGLHRSPEYMLATTSGVAIAQRELDESKYPFGQGRTILFEGIEGFQQAHRVFGTVYREKLNMVVFLINEKQESVERFMHEMEMKHNHGAPWRYSESLSFFGSPSETSYPVSVSTVRTWGELDDILDDKRVQSGAGLQLVELKIQPQVLEVPGLFSGKYGECPSLLTEKYGFMKD